MKSIIILIICCLIVFLNLFTNSDSAGAMQQQYFKLTPRNTQAIVGDDVTLRCEVENLAGKVQWTKDGYALGFAVLVPGFPRYRILRDRDRGVANLLIKNVTLEDDAEFQCQVGPAITPIIHKQIRSGANLTVISPPTHMEIVGYENNSKIEVRENHEIKLQCRAINSKPVAKILWYRGNNELKFDNQEDRVSQSPLSKGKLKLFDIISEIKLQPSVEDDGINYTCEAVHEATNERIRLTSTVQLSVLYPPGLPYIEGYNEGDILRQGQQVDLVCRSRGGNPPAQLVWYKNGEQLHAVYRPLGRISENVYVFTADMTDNKARFTCEASSVINRTRLTTEINLTVHYPPSYVYINGSSEARVGDTISLNCTSGASNPPAQIRWLIDGKEIDNASSGTVLSQYGGWLSYSNVTVFIEANKTAITVICYATNTYIKENKIATHTINVLYPPGLPVIKIHTDEPYMVAGSVHRLSCTSQGGNPLATLTWFKNDKEIASSIRIVDKLSITAEATILVNSSDNDAVYTCEANSSAIDIPLIQVVKLNVYFAPTNVIIRKEPKDLRAGSSAKLICDVSSSNPEAELSWWGDGLSITEGVTKISKSGLYGGRVSSMELNLNITSDMDGKTYTCQATNNALQRSIDSTITLNVLYKPSFGSINDTLIGVEGENMIVSLNVNSRPPVITYTWGKDGFPFIQTPHRHLLSGPVLNFTTLSRIDSGSYTCEAINTVGSSSIRFNIIVQYAASIKDITKVVLVGSGENAELGCSVEGEPLGAEHVTWKRASFPMEKRTSSYYKNATSYLTIHDVTLNDMGLFYCVVDNGIGKEESRSTFLLVKHKPIIDTSEHLSKAASKIGNTAKLVCKAQGAPKVIFSWSRGGTILPVNLTDKYYVVFNQINALDYISTLLIRNIGSQDYGTYGCTARNEIGFSSFNIRLQNVSGPDVPFNVTVVNATHDSITFTWSAAFDGGEMATYRVKYHEDISFNYKYEDVGNETVYTINGLQLATCYNFQVMAFNVRGRSNYTKEPLRACSLSEGPPSLPSRGEVSDGETKIPFIVGLAIVALLIVMNILLVMFCLLRRSRRKYTEKKKQEECDKGSVEMYTSENNASDASDRDTITSVSQKTDHYNSRRQFNEQGGGRTSAMSTYLIEEIDYPFHEVAYDVDIKSCQTNACCRASLCNSVCQMHPPMPIPMNSDSQFITYPPPIQFAQPPLQYVLPQHNNRLHVVPPPDVTIQNNLSTFTCDNTEYVTHVV